MRAISIIAIISLTTYQGGGSVLDPPIPPKIGKDKNDDGPPPVKKPIKTEELTRELTRQLATEKAHTKDLEQKLDAALKQIDALKKENTALKDDAPKAIGKDPTKANVAVVKIKTHADAEIKIDGNETNTTGETRTFTSPTLNPAIVYYYDFTISHDGKTKTLRHQIRANETTTLELYLP